MSPCTRNTLAPWPRTMPGAMASRDLLRGWLWAATSRLSVQHAGAQRARAPSGPPVRGLRAAPRSALEARAGQGHRHWAPRMPQGFGTRGRRVAVAVGAWPAHGTVAEAPQDEGGRRTATGGTPPVCPSATADAVVRGRRSPRARGRVPAGQPLAAGLRPLLAWVGTWGMRRKLLRRERGFDRVRGLPDLSPGALPCLRPAGQRGQTPTPAGGPPAPRHARQRHQVTGPPRPCKGRTKAPAPSTWRCAVTTRGDNEAVPRARLPASRRRFGLASSSRQAHPARLRPSRRTPALRLLCMGVAWGWRQGWGWWHAAGMAQPHRRARPRRPHARRFARWVSILGGTPCSLNDLPRGPDDAAWAWATRQSVTTRSRTDRETTA